MDNTNKKVFLLDIHYKDDKEHVYIKTNKTYTYKSLEDLWNKFKDYIDQHKYIIRNYLNKEFSYQYFIDDIKALFNKDEIIDTLDITNVNYVVDLLVDDTVIQMIGYNIVNYTQQIECFRNRYIFSMKNEGNCIDKFISIGIEPLLENITNLKDSIKRRKDERVLSVEYHQTGCYEKDYAQISLIKRQAEKIVNNCNTHLERISEFYTKL